jgi:hypothetical protein
VWVELAGPTVHELLAAAGLTVDGLLERSAAEEARARRDVDALVGRFLEDVARS